MTVLRQPLSLRDSLPRVSSKIIPEGIHPVAEIALAGPKSGDEPIRRRVVLSPRCCGKGLHGPVRLPLMEP